MQEEYIITNSDDILEKHQSIAVGNEGCVYYLLGAQVENILNQCVIQKKKVRIITPFIPNDYLERVFLMITHWSEVIPNLKVTFNDWGLIYACKDLIEQEKIVPVLGRILTRSMIDCPWYDKLLLSENQEARDATFGYNLYHDSKLNLLNEFHIQEVELNYHPEYVKEWLAIKQSIKITCHPNNLISVGRLCFAARYKKSTFPECYNEKLCLRKYPLSLKAKGFNMSDGSFSEESKKHFLDMYLQGNVVYKEIFDEMPAADILIRGGD